MKNATHTSRQSKGGQAKSPAKKAAARENGKLGGRPRKVDKAKAPHLFVGIFGYNLSADETGKNESDDTRFTALIETTDIHAAVRGFRRLLQHPRVKESIDGIAVEMISCIEIQAMPPAGIVAFVEHLYRRPGESDGHSGIHGSAITVPDGHDGVALYGHKGVFIKGKLAPEYAENDEDRERANGATVS